MTIIKLQNKIVLKKNNNITHLDKDDDKRE